MTENPMTQINTEDDTHHYSICAMIPTMADSLKILDIKVLCRVKSANGSKRIKKNGTDTKNVYLCLIE